MQVGRGRYKHLYGGNGVFSHANTTQYPQQDNYGHAGYDYSRESRPFRGVYGGSRHGPTQHGMGVPFGQMQGGYPGQQQGEHGAPTRGMSKFKTKVGFCRRFSLATWNHLCMAKQNDLRRKFGRAEVASRLCPFLVPWASHQPCMPSLPVLQLCSFFMDSKGLFCPHGPGCQFAHGYDDIRIPGEGGAASQSAPAHLVSLLKQAAAKRAAMGTPVSVLEDPLATLNSVDGQAGAEWAATLARGGAQGGGGGTAASGQRGGYGVQSGPGALPVMPYDRGGMHGRPEHASYSVPAGYYGHPSASPPGTGGGYGGGYGDPGQGGGQYAAPPLPQDHYQQQQGGYGGYSYETRRGGPATSTSGSGVGHRPIDQGQGGKGGTTTALQLGGGSGPGSGDQSTPGDRYVDHHHWAGPGGGAGVAPMASASSASAPGADMYSMVDYLTSSVNGLHLHEQGAGGRATGKAPERH